MGSEQYSARMSLCSYSTSIMTAPWRATEISKVAQREAESCSWVKTGWKL